MSSPLTIVRRMVTCRWTARRLTQYLDADPAAPLTPGEVARLEAHLAECAMCTRALASQRSLVRALAGWGRNHPADPAAVERARALLDDLAEGGDRPEHGR